MQSIEPRAAYHAAYQSCINYGLGHVVAADVADATHSAAIEVAEKVRARAKARRARLIREAIVVLLGAAALFGAMGAGYLIK